MERKQEDGRMFELGSVLNTGYSVPAANPTLNGTSSSAVAADSSRNADDARATVIADPLAVEIVGAAYAAVEISGNAQPQLEQTRDAAKEPRYPIYSDVSELVIKLREEIGAVNSFDGFLLGVHDEIEEFRKYMELDIRHITEFVQRIQHQTGSPQQHNSWSARAAERALAPWQSQANLDPDRVLALLKDATEQEPAEAGEQLTTPPQQTA